MNPTEQPPPPDSPGPGVGAADRLAQAVDSLVRQVAHWQPGRWSASAGSASPAGLLGGPDVGGPGESRADRVYALVQRLADRGADVERRPRVSVPRLSDLALPDQLRVLADDLLAAGSPVDPVHSAADDVDAVRRTL